MKVQTNPLKILETQQWFFKVFFKFFKISTMGGRIKTKLYATFVNVIKRLHNDFKRVGRKAQFCKFQK